MRDKYFYPLTLTRVVYSLSCRKVGYGGRKEGSKDMHRGKLSPLDFVLEFDWYYFPPPPPSLKVSSLNRTLPHMRFMQAVKYSTVCNTCLIRTWFGKRTSNLAIAIRDGRWSVYLIVQY